MPGLRAFHPENAGGRSGAAGHMFYYAIERLAEGDQRVVILRRLHEGMEPRLQIARASMPR